MPDQLNEERVELRVATDDLRRWRLAAEDERMTLSAWIRAQCNHGAIAFEIGDSIVRRRSAKKGK